MEIKLFGKSLFKFKSARSELLWEPATNMATESKYLPDFNKGGLSATEIFSDFAIVDTLEGSAVAVPINSKGGKKKKGKEKVAEASYKITPKGVHELKLLHDETFKINTNPEYVEKQLTDFKEKLNLIKSEEFDMRRGVDEISSIIVRMENRKKYGDFKTFFEEFPYTTSTKIREVVKAHSHLQLGQVAQFIADMPKDAVEVMKKYNENTDKLCGKKAVFYIIADKKDFRKTDTRRDPILLAQSPFGHFWQILGAWDEEMMFLEEL